VADHREEPGDEDRLLAVPGKECFGALDLVLADQEVLAVADQERLATDPSSFEEALHSG